MTVTLTGMQRSGAARMKKFTYAASVGTEVRVRMARLDVSQTALAEALGLTQTAISRRLRGDVAFDVTELAAVAELLGSLPGDFLPVNFEGEPVSEVRERHGLARLSDSPQGRAVTNRYPLSEDTDYGMAA